MITAWTNHLKTSEEKERFEQLFRNSSSVLERLEELVKSDLNGLERSETDIKSYDSPSWSHKQAHKNGAREAFNTILKLINQDQLKEKHDRPIQFRQ